MKTFWVIGIGLGLAALVVAVAVLYSRAHPSSDTAYFEARRELTRIVRLEGELDNEILKARAGATIGPDRVAALLGEVESAMTTFEASIPSRFDVDAAELASAVASYRTALRGRAARIADFTRDRAALLAAADETVSAAARIVLPAGATRAHAESLAGMIDLMARLHQVASARPDERKLQELLTAIDRALPASASPGGDATAVLAEVAAALKRNAEIVRTTAASLGQAMAIPGGTGLDDTLAIVDRMQDRARAQSANHEGYLLLAVGFLASLVAYAAYRMYGSYRTARDMNASLRDTVSTLDGQVTRIATEMQDAMRRLHESEAQLIQTEKMSSLGEMVAGVAHEINTPLAYVRSNLELLAARSEEVSGFESLLRALAEVPADAAQREATLVELHERVRDLVEASIATEMNELATDGVHGVKRISEIVDSLRSFSRSDRGAQIRFDLHEAIDTTLTIAHNLLKRKGQVRTIRGDIPQVIGAPAQMNQVILNLVTNAAHAVGEDGSILLRTSVEKDGRVRLDVADNGCGIPPEVLPKIFDPFFTTKEVGRGTGLGLSIVHKIVHQHGGEVKVRSQLGKGAIFSVLLPAAQELGLAELDADQTPFVESTLA
jgi:two-component system NtrC family sensor kinase